MNSRVIGITTIPKYLFAIIAVAALSVLSGCAVTPEYREKSEPQSVTLEPKKGIVIVKVGSNRNVDTFFGKWQTLNIKNVETGDTFSLVDRSPPHALHSFYVGSVPVGTYRLDKFDSQAHGYVSILVSANLGAKYGRFQVSDQGVTDLGTILYLRPYFPLNTKLYKVVFSHVELESEKNLDTLAPTVAEAAKTNTLGWLPTTTSESRPPYVKGQHSASMFLNDPHRTNNNEILFGEALGQISRRDKDGKWSFIDTGTLNTIQSLHITEEGAILAGSEQSLLLIKHPESQEWKALPFPLKDASIRFIGKHHKLGTLVVAQDRRNIVILASKELHNPVWSELKRIPVELFLNPAMDTRFRALLSNNKLTVITTTVAFTLKMEFHIFDIDNNTWSEIPVDLYSTAFSALPNGSIYAMAGPNISQHFYISQNNGKTWDKRNSPNWMHQPVFRNSNEGYCIRIENVPLVDPEKLTNSLWKTTNGGKSWSKIGDIPNQSATLVLLDSVGELLLMTSNGKIFHSKDDGITWSMERSLTLQ